MIIFSVFDALSFLSSLEKHFADYWGSHLHLLLSEMTPMSDLKKRPLPPYASAGGFRVWRALAFLSDLFVSCICLLTFSKDVFYIVDCSSAASLSQFTGSISFLRKVFLSCSFNASSEMTICLGRRISGIWARCSEHRSRWGVLLVSVYYEINIWYLRSWI